MTLLESVKQEKIKRPRKEDITKEHVELALAWARDEVSLSQLQSYFTKNFKTKNYQVVYAMLAKALKRHIKEAI